MTETGNGLSKTKQLFTRTLRVNLISIGIISIAVGLLLEGIFPYFGLLIGALSIFLAFSKFVEIFFQYVSQRRGETYIKFFSVLTPVLISIVTLIFPILMWVAWKTGIPFDWIQTSATFLILLVAILAIVLLVLNIIAIFRNQSE